MRVVWNPSDAREAHLAALNDAFPGWGGEGKYAWYFERETADRAPDLLVACDHDAIVGGSAILYRSLRFENSTRSAGIITGAWTSPAYRSQGIFSRLIEQSIAHLQLLGVDVLLGFMRESNPSARVLERLGARLSPTKYFRSAELKSAERSALLMESSIDEQAIERLWRATAAAAATHVAFHYESRAAFEGQHVRRPSPTQLWEDSLGNLAVIEADGPRALAQLILFGADDLRTRSRFITALDRRARETGRDLLVFACGRGVEAACKDAGLDGSPGFVAHVNFTETELSAPWLIFGGDRS